MFLWLEFIYFQMSYDVIDLNIFYFISMKSDWA